MDQTQADAALLMTEEQTNKLRQGVTLGRMRYVLGISLTLAILALAAVYLIALH